MALEEFGKVWVRDGESLVLNLISQNRSGTDLAETGTTGKVASVAGDIASNIAGDPLTYTPAAVISVPYKLIRGAFLKMIAATRPVQAGINAAPVRTVLEAFNVYVGDAGKAKRIMDDLRRQQRGANILSDREEVLLNEELAAIATRAGVSVPELKSALLQDIETGLHLPSQVDEAGLVERNVLLQK